MPANAFIANSKSRTLKKRLGELIHRTSYKSLEKLWLLTAEDFTRRVGVDGIKAYQSAREETMFATEEIVRVEGEIDKRAASLYGVKL